MPEFKPDFEKFKREYLDKAAPPTEEDVRRIEEWNAQVRVERTQKVHRVASVVACAVLALTVVTSAIRMGRDSGVVPNPESGVSSSNVGDISEVDVESAPTSDTSASEWPELENGVVSYEQAVQLTGLPLVKADEMDGFVEYIVDIAGDKIVKVVYVFGHCSIYVYCDRFEMPNNSELTTITLADRHFIVKQVESTGVIKVYYSSQEDIVFEGVFTGKSVDESVQILNTLVF